MKKKHFALILSFLIIEMCYSQVHSIYENQTETNQPAFFIIVSSGIGIFLAVFTLAFKNLKIEKRRIINIVALGIIVICQFYQYLVLNEYNLYKNGYGLLLLRNAAISFWCYDYAIALKVNKSLYQVLGFILPGLSMFLLMIKKHRINKHKGVLTTN